MGRWVCTGVAPSKTLGRGGEGTGGGGVGWGGGDLYGHLKERKIDKHTQTPPRNINIPTYVFKYVHLS